MSIAKARAGPDEKALADINTHIHKLSCVLESLIIDLLNQRAHMRATARGTTSTGVHKRFNFCITVDVWCLYLALKTGPLVPTASTECMFSIENSEAAC